MKIETPKGRYVVAVSGGVDSIVLLNLLSKLHGLNLVVAHFNHGIRDDSAEDEIFTRQLASKYGLPFVAGRGKLGAKASEEKARQARYQFLNEAKKRYGADKVITAHHQDDLIETAILNILRGTGRRGLTAISANPDILRPMLHIPKKDILDYAKQHKLVWREDPTNKDERFLRNYIRRRILPKLNQEHRRQFLENLEETAEVNKSLNLEIAKLSQKVAHGRQLNRSALIGLPTEIAREVLMYFLRRNGIRQFDKPTIERLLLAVKTAKIGSRHDVTRGAFLKIGTSNVLLVTGD